MAVTEPTLLWRKKYKCDTAIRFVEVYASEGGGYIETYTNCILSGGCNTFWMTTKEMDEIAVAIKKHRGK